MKKTNDDLCPNDKRLKYKWRWLENVKGSQISLAHIGNWKLEAVKWGSIQTGIRYEPCVDYYDDPIIRMPGGHIDSNFFKTRIEAQIFAEEMLEDWIFAQYKLLGL
jgi:hypothetical protein